MLDPEAALCSPEFLWVPGTLARTSAQLLVSHFDWLFWMFWLKHAEAVINGVNLMTPCWNIEDTISISRYFGCGNIPQMVAAMGRWLHWRFYLWAQWSRHPEAHPVMQLEISIKNKGMSYIYIYSQKDQLNRHISTINNKYTSSHGRCSYFPKLT